MNAPEERLIVVGGGIGGVTTALAMARAGHHVRVLEQASEFSEVGAGLQMAPNATRQLARLGVLDRVVELGVLPQALVFHNAVNGEPLTRVELNEEFQQRFGGPYVVLHRSDLLDTLVDAAAQAGVELVTGARVEKIEEDESNGVRVHCADGTVHPGAAALACDGLHSTTRRLFSDDEPVQSGYVAYRGTIPIEDVQGGENLRDVLVWMGPGMHLVQYPLRYGSLYNQVGVFRSPGFGAGVEDFGGPEELDAMFAPACEQVRRALPGLGRSRRWPMADREPISTWTKGRIALLGDAAHPMLQYLAQGACQAVEDAVALADSATDVVGTGPDTDASRWPAALERYASARGPRAALVQRAARLWGEIWHVDGVAALLRDEVFRDRAADDLSRATWLWQAGC